MSGLDIIYETGPVGLPSVYSFLTGDLRPLCLRMESILRRTPSRSGEYAVNAVLREGPYIAGAATASVYPLEGSSAPGMVLECVCLHPAWRGQGNARALVKGLTRHVSPVLCIAAPYCGGDFLLGCGARQTGINWAYPDGPGILVPVLRLSGGSVRQAAPLLRELLSCYGASLRRDADFPSRVVTKTAEKMAKLQTMFIDNQKKINML